jgi:hypothetical protein
MTRASAAEAPKALHTILSRDGRTLTVRIPVSFQQHKGRKQVVTPPGAAPWMPCPARVDDTMVKAIVRAFRWRDMLESGRYCTIRDLAKAEAINESYLGRILRLTLLSPTFIKEILEGRQSPSLELDDLLSRFPVEWDKQIEWRGTSEP